MSDWAGRLEVLGPPFHPPSRITRGSLTGTAIMHVEHTFTVGRPPEMVFDYLTNRSNLAEWQTSKTSVEQLTDGPPGLGSRFRERTRHATPDTARTRGRIASSSLRARGRG